MSRAHSHDSMGDGSWISWFLAIKGNEFVCRVPTDYIEDKFNLTGLEYFSQTLDLVLDPEFDHQGWDNGVDTTDAEQLYGMIHARYILTARGVEDMCLKYERGDFGVCPRVFCKGQRTLPVGLSDQWTQSHVKIYCPRCHDIYQPRSRCALLDGAMFGTGFPHMFFMQLPNMKPQPPTEKYVARLFGFQLHEQALMPSETPEPVPISHLSSTSKSTFLESTNPNTLPIASRHSPFLMHKC
ncbi:suppressor-of-stellate-like protein [Drosophila eugracilis]|uniref:suppressor-of-stellate-like protein n=1 Tax=Drosophila eugracilis TaxID=29029 RepID=UPI001BD9F66F|nr:suppressor-of-stellate-like protein [Drosophila eugracilis]